VDQIKLAKEEAQEEAGRLAWCNWLNIDYHWLVIFGTTKMGGTVEACLKAAKVGELQIWGQACGVQR
jgi:hypothetical protein